MCARTHCFAQVELGLAKVYHASNPFTWMELISLQGKSNFFEKRVSEYAKSGVSHSPESGGGARIFAMDAEF